MHIKRVAMRARARNSAVRILREVRANYSFPLVGYVIMPEYVHLLIGELPMASPARVVKVFKQRVSHFMREKKRTAAAQLPLPFPGSVAELRRFWQRRHYDFNVHRRAKMKEKLEYMHANPVKEKLVQYPRDCPWSGWSYYATGQGLLNMDVPWACER